MTTQTMKPGALDGVRVADFSWVWAGPYCATLLGFLGAEVIKIESRNRIDQTRKGSILEKEDFHGLDMAPPFNNANLNKKSVSINIGRPEGAALARRVVSKCDIVVANMRPGKMDKLGLGYKDFVKVKPDIIMAEATGFGSTGPYRGYAGFAPVFAAFGGLAYLTGYEDDLPNVMSGVQDLRVGTMAAGTILGALVHRQRTGEGQYIDISSSECLSSLVGADLLEYSLTGRSPKRCGNEDRIMAPHQVYRCKGEDKWVSIAVGSDEEWEALCAAMGSPKWAKAPEYGDMVSRHEHRAELDRHMAEWTIDYTQRELMQMLQAVGVACMPSFCASEVLSDPNTKARDMVTGVYHPYLKQQYVVSPPWKLSETPATIRTPAPLMGQHNEEILKGLVGCSEEEYRQLEETGVLY